MSLLLLPQRKQGADNEVSHTSQKAVRPAVPLDNYGHGVAEMRPW